MVSFTVSEPQPTVAKGAYMHSGRGGAGNYFRAPQTVAATNVATRVPSEPTVAPRRFFSGRGGAGNMHDASEAVPVNLEEEYKRAAHHADSTIGHVGRGGAGNVFRSSKSTDGSSSRRSSGDSGESARSGFWQRLSISSLHH